MADSWVCISPPRLTTPFGPCAQWPMPATAEALASSQGLPPKFLESILNDLRRAGLLRSQRGAEGGYRLARTAKEITVADIIRPLDGPLAEVRGLRPEAANYEGAAAHLQDVWVAAVSYTHLTL